VKTTLCLTCEFGLVREYDCQAPECKVRHFSNKCLIGKDYIDMTTGCNRYRKTDRKITYHDPDFKEYEKKVEGEENG